MNQEPTPYPHWMLHEIYEQPASLDATLDAFLDGEWFRDDVCLPILRFLKDSQELVITASGSSRHAGMVAEVLIEDRCGLPVDVEYASEYTLRSERAMKSANVVVLSQSGETGDTLAALRRANLSGRRTLAITNVYDSTMAKEANVTMYTAAGLERAVPATKSFTCQLVNISLLSLLAALQRRTMSDAEIAYAIGRLRSIPDALEVQLDGWEAAARTVAKGLAGVSSLLFLGRDVHYPIAREGALKLKESAYLHAEGYPSGELKHGPNALVDESVALVMLATFDPNHEGSVRRYAKTVSLMEDMRAQGARILAVANTGDERVAQLTPDVLYIDPATEETLPICEVVPLQMLSYVMAVHAGINVDLPRNLSKAVLQD